MECSIGCRGRGVSTPVWPSIFTKCPSPTMLTQKPEVGGFKFFSMCKQLQPCGNHKSFTICTNITSNAMATPLIRTLVTVMYSSYIILHGAVYFFSQILATSPRVGNWAFQQRLQCYCILVSLVVAISCCCHSALKISTWLLYQNCQTAILKIYPLYSMYLLYWS